MIKRIVFIFSTILMISFTGFSQDKFATKNGKISFFSSTSVENISAVNKSAVAVLNTKSGDLQFAVLLKGFEFRKALMQEHFNSDYVESDKFPRSEFKGQITNNSAIAYGTNGSYPAKVTGKLMIHGVTHDVETTGTIIVKDGTLTLSSDFNVLLADYQISVPRLYQDNISKSIKISVDCSLASVK